MFGLLGGFSNISKSAIYLYDKVVERNRASLYTPLWGTCLGFEWLMISASRNLSILDRGFNSWNLSIPLNFSSDIAFSQLFSRAPPNIVKTMSTKPVTMNNHNSGILVSTFLRDPILPKFFSILSTNRDRDGRHFVSTVESYDMPIFGVQWHPEKNIFE